MPNNDFEYYLHSAALESLGRSSLANKLADIPTHAQIMYDNIVDRIKRFEAKLPDNMQAGGCLVSAPGTIFSISTVTYMDPDLIIFTGLLPDGSTVELLQHVTQVNLLMVAVQRTDNLNQPRREIGFHPKEQQQPKP